jgi:hypothetical protein
MPGMGNGILSLEVKCLGCEVDPSPPSNAEIKRWSITSTPPFAFIPKAPYFWWTKYMQTEKYVPQQCSST